MLIDKKFIFQRIVLVFINIALSIYYTYSYATLPGDVRHQSLSNWFLAYIIALWGNVYNELYEIRVAFNVYNQEISANLWYVMSQDNSFPFQYCKLSASVMIITGCHIATKFIPLDNCHIYDTNACISLQMISVITVVYLSFFAFVLLTYLLRLLWAIVRHCRDYHNYDDIQINTNANTHINQQSVNVNAIANFLRSYNPISNFMIGDDDCSICMTNKDADPTLEWIQLPCGHKFHTNCVSEWGKYQLTCPNCRKPIVPNRTVDNTDNV